MKRFQILLLALAAVTLLGASQCNNQNKKEITSKPAEAPKVNQEPTETTTQPATTPVESSTTGNKVKIITPFGNMIAVLYDETPKHRDNFLKLVDQKYYDDLLWHRCIQGFMIQGGDPDSKGAAPEKHLGMGGPGYKVPAEFKPNLIHKKGALAAARQGGPGNPLKESSGSQFYIVQGRVLNDAEIAQTENYINTRVMPGFKYTDAQKNLYKTIGGTAQLDMDYTVFGEVLEGLSVIDSINAQPTNPSTNRPLKDITMRIERVK